MNTPTSKELRQLRALAHKLRPVVTIAGKGLSSTVLEELERALNDHELIKVKVAVGDREQRELVIAEVCERSQRRARAAYRKYRHATAGQPSGGP